MWQIWLIITGLCFIIEFFTVGFLVFWFGIGALITMVLSFFTDNIIIQTSVFIISSTILLFATRPFVNKITKNIKTVKTNAFSIIGKTGIVTEKIDSTNSTGQIKIGPEVWSAASNDNTTIEVGTQIEVCQIKGVKAIVTPTNKI